MSAAAPYIAEFKANSLDDGPGIRGVVFFKGCPLSCIWCHNPECVDREPVVTYDAAKCVRDPACPSSCSYVNRGGAPLVRDVNRGGAPLVRDANRGGAPLPQKDECPYGALETVGKAWRLDELLRMIDKFAPFYRNSGGGVTLSGGEATMHLDFAASLAGSLKARGIHTLLETCGLFPWAPFETELAPALDQIYFDLKIMEPAAHRTSCGADNATILANFRKLVQLARDGGPAVLPRVPLVPGVTDGEANLTAIAGFLRDCGVARVSLLPYNPLWTDKARKLGMTVNAALPTTWMAKGEVERCKGCFGGFEIV